MPRIPVYNRRASEELPSVPQIGHTSKLFSQLAQRGDPAGNYAEEISKYNLASAELAGKARSPYQGSDNAVSVAQRQSSILGRIAEKQQEEIDVVDYAKFKAMADITWANTLAQGLDSEDYINIIPKINQQWGEYSEKSIESIQNGRIKKKAQDYLEIKTISGQGELQSAFLKRQKDHVKAEYLDAMDSLIDSRDSVTAIATIDSLGNNVFSQQEKFKLKKNVLRQIDLLNANDDIDNLGGKADFSEYGNLTTEDKKKLENKREPYIIQDITEEVFTMFNEDEEAGLNYIKDKYAGVRENKLMTSFRSRMNEVDMKKALEKRQESEAEKEAFQSFAQRVAQNEYLSDFEMNKAKEVLSPQSFLRLTQQNKHLANYEKVYLQMSKDDYSFNELSESEKQSKVMGKLGISQRERDSTVNALTEKASNGTLQKSDITTAYNLHRISRQEYDRLLEIAQTKFPQEAQHFKSTLNKMFTSKQATKSLLSEAEESRLLAEFNRQVILAPKDINEYEKIFQNTIIDIISNVKQTPLTTESWNPFKWKETVLTSAGEAFVEAGGDESILLNMTEKQNIQNEQIFVDVKGLKEFETVETPEAVEAVTSMYNSIVVDTAGSPLSSRYGAPRDGGKRAHGGIDFAMPEGTPIKVMPFAGNTHYKVSRIFNSGKSGHSISLLGSNGESITFMHLKESPDIKPGTIISSGDIVGFSGKSGNATGATLHVEVRDKNGKTMSPQQVAAHHNVMVEAQQGQEQPPARRKTMEEIWAEED